MASNAQLIASFKADLVRLREQVESLQQLNAQFPGPRATKPHTERLDALYQEMNHLCDYINRMEAAAVPRFPPPRVIAYGRTLNNGSVDIVYV